VKPPKEAELAGKTGRIGQKEREAILKMAESMTVEQIAAKLNRNDETIRRIVRRFYKEPTREDAAQKEKVALRQSLRDSEMWRRLKDEFVPAELKFFEEQYLQLMSQFREDVLPTEQGQVFDAIKFDILKSRNLMARKKALRDIERLESLQANLLAQHNDDVMELDEAGRAQLLNIESQLRSARDSEREATDEFSKLQQRYDSIIRDLKATRSQRIKDVESGRETFLGLIKMLQQRDVAESEGRQFSLVRLAAEKEYRRLGEVHTYEDSSADRPILSPDTVGDDD
jgi:hypothetical protein